MPALLQGPYLVVQDVHVLVCSEGKGNLGRAGRVFQSQGLYKQAEQIHIAPSVASLTTCYARRSVHAFMPCARTGKTHH